jgi:heterotetrameric sarcosine oxidase gamma subunit
MLERVLALASARPYVSSSLTIAERPGFTLTQVAGFDADFEAKLTAAAGPLPEGVGRAQVNGERVIFRIGPAQFWLIEPASGTMPARLDGVGAVTPLSHGRTRIAIEGAPARDVLSMLIPIDLHNVVFTPGSVALTGIHHTPVTVHCTGENAFDIYVMRSFALTVWEVVTDAALVFAERS